MESPVKQTEIDDTAMYEQAGHTSVRVVDTLLVCGACVVLDKDDKVANEKPILYVRCVYGTIKG